MNPADGKSTSLDNALDTRPLAPPGCLWRHTQTGRFYWKVASRLVPEPLRGRGQYTNISLVPKGGKRGARTKLLADRIRRMLWREWGSPVSSSQVSTSH